MLTERGVTSAKSDDFTTGLIYISDQCVERYKISLSCQCKQLGSTTCLFYVMQCLVWTNNNISCVCTYVFSIRLTCFHNYSRNVCSSLIFPTLITNHDGGRYNMRVYQVIPREKTSNAHHICPQMKTYYTEKVCFCNAESMENSVLLSHDNTIPQKNS